MSIVAKQLDGSTYQLVWRLASAKPDCVGWRPSHLPLKGAQQPRVFRPKFIEAKRLDGSRCHFTEVGLGPGDIELHGDPAPPKRHTAAPTFWPCLLWPNGEWIKMPVGTEVGLSPGHIALDGDLFPKRGTAAPPTFWLTSIVAKQSPISATAELLFSKIHHSHMLDIIR